MDFGKKDFEKQYWFSHTYHKTVQIYNNDSNNQIMNAAILLVCR